MTVMGSPPSGSEALPLAIDSVTYPHAGSCKTASTWASGIHDQQCPGGWTATAVERLGEVEGRTRAKKGYENPTCRYPRRELSAGLPTMVPPRATRKVSLIRCTDNSGPEGVPRPPAVREDVGRKTTRTTYYTMVRLQNIQYGSPWAPDKAVHTSSNCNHDTDFSHKDSGFRWCTPPVGELSHRLKNGDTAPKTYNIETHNAASTLNQAPQGNTIRLGGDEVFMGGGQF